MSHSNCYFLTYIQVSQETVVNFPYQCSFQISKVGFKNANSLILEEMKYKYPFSEKVELNQNQNLSNELMRHN